MKNILLSVVLVLFWVELVFSQTKANFTTHQGKFILTTEQGILSITPYAPNLFRIALTSEFPFNDTDGVSMNAQENLSVRIEENNHHIVINSDSLKIEIDTSNLSISFYTIYGKRVALHESFFQEGASRGFRFRLNPAEMIFGGGEGAIPLNRRGYKLNLNNEPHWGYGWGEENLNFSVPHFISSENYSIYFDNGSIGYADIGKTNPNQLEVASLGGNNSYFFSYNQDQRGLQKTFALLTGTQPMPPRWAFGNLMSRFGYESEKEAREKLDSMQAAGYPVDAIILDLYWFGRGPADWMMGNLDWYRPNWPTPEKMISDFKKKGVQTILITEPYLLESSKNFAEADQLGFLASDSLGKTNIIEDFFFGRAGLIDLFDTNASGWFWKFYRKQIEIGVEGWWGDLGEPEKFHDDLFFSIGPGPHVKNLYGHYWSKMLADNYNKFYPNKRLFHLNRAGFAGSQRYGSFPWSGDVSRTWGGFHAQLPNLLSMSLSNIPYAHSDLGGFCAEGKNEELYLRWLQFGVFNPIFRPHSEKVPSEPIYYSDSIQQGLKPFFELRYKLLPYHYTLAWQQEQFGEPLASPLFIHHNLPRKSWGLYHEYSWGEAFLVAPVLEAGIKSMEIYLPAGIWFDFFTGERYLGNSIFKKDIDYETIPVFVKAGSFIPMTQNLSSTSYYNPDTLDLHFYYDPTVDKASYTLYDDDGLERNAYLNKRYETLHVAFKKEANEWIFDFENAGFDYPGRAAKRCINLIIHSLSSEKPEFKARVELYKNCRNQLIVPIK